MFVALAGGVGAARLLAGLVQVVDPTQITAVVNTADDMTLHGLHISPDIDTVTYTLAGMNNEELGWGIRGESWRVMEALEGLGGEHWFRLGDLDLATHLFRTQRLAEGLTLGQVTAELAQARGIGVRLLPMTDDPVGTKLTVELPGADGPTEVDFQDYFVRLRHDVAVRSVRFAGADEAAPCPGVLEAIKQADRLIVCPSNPIVSIGPLLAVRGIHDALRTRRADVVAVSPIIAGHALKGPADRLLAELGHDSSVIGVARLYRDWVGTLVIDEADESLGDGVEAEGVRAVVAPTIMSSPDKAASLAKVVLDVAPVV